MKRIHLGALTVSRRSGCVIGGISPAATSVRSTGQRHGVRGLREATGQKRAGFLRARLTLSGPAYESSKAVEQAANPPAFDGPLEAADWRRIGVTGNVSTEGRTPAE